MKARTKLQQQVEALSKELHPITVSQQRWARRDCFDHYARKTKQGVVSCLECGKQWTDKHLTKKKIVCPHCHTKLTVKETRAYKFKQVEYLCIITTCGGFQVLRFFYLENNTRKGEQADFYCREVVQRWIAPNGKSVTRALLRSVFCFSDSWQWSSSLEIRPDKELYNIPPTKIYPRMNLLPILKRNGFSGPFYGLPPFELFRALLRENRAETLLKTGQIALLKHFVYRQFRDIDALWPSIRICLRNSYTVEEASLWCDLIPLLAKFNRDILSPKYVCPADLRTEHDSYVKKRQEQQEREQAEKKRLKIAEDEERFRELKAKFFGLRFEDNTIEVRVLESVQAHYEEGKSLRHCVYQSDYHLKPDSLILSAYIEGKRLETVEFSLSALQVVQCRGMHNSNSEYHDQIVQLVNTNKWKIQSRISA